MNSLNILSSRVIGQTSRPPRSRSLSDGLRSKELPPAQPKRSASQHTIVKPEPESDEKLQPSLKTEEEDAKNDDSKANSVDENTPLLEKLSEDIPLEVGNSKSRVRLIVKRVVDALTHSIKWVLSKLIAPGVYVVACFYNEEGRFSPLAPIHRTRRRSPPKNGTKSTANAVGLSRTSESSDSDQFESEKSASKPSHRRRIASPATSDSEVDSRRKAKDEGREKKSGADSKTARRSIRIKLNNEETARRKKQRKQERTASDVAKGTAVSQEEAAAAELKSPTSPASSLRITKYPHAPSPPRPLIPRRQPSYSSPSTKTSSKLAHKTLVIDLDETLIHSLAKGGRMSSGHMVEVRLAHPAAYNGLALGPQHPILYYVHKRPHCDDFLRMVSKWYNLVVFTASVQEYADPVIDWLEQERKYFSARYYRQHCTFRNGAYIKDLSSVEPDLSKVMILDNSPLSYIFHEGMMFVCFGTIRLLLIIYRQRHSD